MDKTNVYFTNKYQTSRAMTTRKQGGRIHKKAENTRQAKTWDNRQRSEMEEVVEKQLQIFEVTIREMHEESWKGDEGVCRKKEKKKRRESIAKTTLHTSSSNLPPTLGPTGVFAPPS